MSLYKASCTGLDAEDEAHAIVTVHIDFFLDGRLLVRPVAVESR
jgi:hypothetical protein